MALQSWPSELPAPQRPSFQFTPLRVVNSTPVEDGPIIMRLQSLTTIRKLSMEFIFNTDEMVTFEDFVENTLHGGVDHFIMSVPLTTDEYVSRRCYIEDANWSGSKAGPEVFMITFTLHVFTAALS